MTVHALTLRSQIRIEPQIRRYDAAEADHLLEMFGETPQWGDSLRPFLWTYVDTTLGGFSAETSTELSVPCTYDFEVAGAKYMHALSDGDIPLLFLFSGTVFSKAGSGLSVEPVPWNRECHFRLPVAVWRRTMDIYFPESGWLRLPRRTIDRLQRFKASQALPTWEQAMDALLKEAGEEDL